MRVFISWSGELSRQLGEIIRGWLPSALQYVKPYFTPNDIDKGAKWASEISKELVASSVCIIVLTRDNLASDWIMFEAGAISSTLDNSKVCPVLFDLQPTDLQGPLAQFQATTFAKSDFKKLFRTINALAVDSRLQDGVVDSVFEKWWPDLEDSLRNALASHISNGATKVRADRDLIEEILTLLRSTEKAAPAKRVGPYVGSTSEALLKVIKFLVDNDGFASNDEIHEQLIDLNTFLVDRLPESDGKALMLREVHALLDQTKPKPPRRKVPSPPPDDIPF